MKKITSLILLLFIIVFYSCEETGSIEDIEAAQAQQEAQAEINAYKPDNNQQAPVYSYKFISGTDVEDDGCYSEEYRLYGGQHIDVGSVTFSNDSEYLYVTYTTDGDWYLKETHLYVGCPMPEEPNNGIPSNGGGNPVIGHFPFTADHDPMVQSYTYRIRLKGFEECLDPETGDPECLIIATHASVALIGDGGEEQQSETAFQECTDKTYDFAGQRWGCYSEFCPMPCEEEEIEQLAWLFKDKRIDEFVTCINDGDDNGFSNEFHTDWFDMMDYDATYPINIEVGDDCVSYGTAVGNVDLDIVSTDLGDQLQLNIIMNSGYKIKSYNIYVGWTNPVFEGALDGSIIYDSMDYSTPINELDYLSLISNWAGTIPVGDSPAFHVIVKLDIETDD